MKREKGVKKKSFSNHMISNIRQVFTTTSSKLLTMSRKALLFSILIPIVVTVGVSTYLIRNHSSSVTQEAGPATTTSLLRGTPTYSTLLPAGKSADALGGWTRVSPQGSDPVFAYTDKIDQSAISVSEQPIPTEFSEDTESSIEQLAKDFGATEKIAIGQVSVYLATYKDGIQRAIFTKNKLLILIKSDSKLSNDQWITYINSLQ